MFATAPGRWLALAFLSLLLALFLGNPVLLAGAVYLLVVVLIGATLLLRRGSPSGGSCPEPSVGPATV